MRVIGWLATLALVVLVFIHYGLAWGLVVLLLLAVFGLIWMLGQMGSWMR